MMQEKTLNSKELVHILGELCVDKRYKKRETLPKFTIKEAQFIRDLIFLKPKGLVYFYLADHIGNQTEIGRSGLFNSMGYRKYIFLGNFLECKGNATKAAILSGYSKRSAKQQGHRMLRQVQGFCGRKS